MRLSAYSNKVCSAFSVTITNSWMMKVKGNISRHANYFLAILHSSLRLLPEGEHYIPHNHPCVCPTGCSWVCNARLRFVQNSTLTDGIPINPRLNMQLHVHTHTYACALTRPQTHTDRHRHIRAIRKRKIIQHFEHNKLPFFTFVVFKVSHWTLWVFKCDWYLRDNGGIAAGVGTPNEFWKWGWTLQLLG